jgi:aminopeptidase N
MKNKPALIALLSLLVFSTLACNALNGGLPQVPEITVGITPRVMAPTEAVTPQTAGPTPDNPNPGPRGLGDSYFPDLGNAGYDVLSYHITLDVDMDTNEVSGGTQISAVASQDLTSFNLEFLGLQIDSLRVDGQEAFHQREEAELIIFPATPLIAGDTFLVEVNYQGTPGAGVDLSSLPEYSIGWGWYGDGVYVAGEPTGSSAWYPVNEHPLDKATYSYAITVDEPYVVGANGTLVEREELSGGKVTYHWQMSDPIASYLATVAIGEFDIETDDGPDGLPIRNYFASNLPDETRRDFANTPQMIEYFSEIFGPYPFEAYGVVVHDLDLGFALETATLSVFGRGFTNEEVVSHELAHQWFGDSVGLKDWRDIWLNEGFATYASLLWAEHAYGRETMDLQIRGLYEGMAAGEPIFDISREELADGLYGLLPEQSYPAEDVTAALQNLLLGPFTDEEVAAAVEEIGRNNLDSEDIRDVILALDFDEITLFSGELSDFFITLGNAELAGDFAVSYPPPGDPGGDDLFSSSVYERGALTLHALRLEIGDQAFFDTLRTYTSRFEHGNANTADFIAVAEEVSDQDLSALFEAWLYAKDMPDIPEMDLFRQDFLE